MKELLFILVTFTVGTLVGMSLTNKHCQEDMTQEYRRVVKSADSLMRVTDSLLEAKGLKDPWGK